MLLFHLPPVDRVHVYGDNRRRVMTTFRLGQSRLVGNQVFATLHNTRRLRVNSNGFARLDARNTHTTTLQALGNLALLATVRCDRNTLIVRVLPHDPILHPPFTRHASEVSMTHDRTGIGCRTFLSLRFASCSLGASYSGTASLGFRCLDTAGLFLGCSSVD